MKDKLLTAASVLTAFLSSLCCIAPLTLIGFGTGIVAFSSQFSELRPYFAGASIMFLIPAIILVTKKSEIECEDGTCRIKKVSKWNKVVVWLSTLAVLFFISFPYLGFETTAAVNENKISEGYTLVKLKINNMDCAGCARTLEQELTKVKGIKSANISYSKGNGLIEFDPGRINKKEIIGLIETEGFSSEEIVLFH